MTLQPKNASLLELLRPLPGFAFFKLFSLFLFISCQFCISKPDQYSMGTSTTPLSVQA